MAKPMINYRVLSCLFSFTCFLLLLVAHVSHSWKTYHPSVGISSMGLWTICSELYGCKKLDRGDVSMAFIQTFMLLALVATFMAVVWAIEWDHLFHCNFGLLPKALMASVCNFVAGTSVLIAVVVFEIEIDQIPQKRIAFKSWAFYLSCCVGALCLVIAHIDLVAYKCSLWEMEESDSDVGPEQKQATGSPTVAPALL